MAVLPRCSRVTGLELVASISQRGVRGEIRFSGAEDGAAEGAAVLATADLQVALGAEGEYTWGIYEFPIDYTKVRRGVMCCKCRPVTR